MRCTRRRTLLLSRHVSSCATNDQFVHIVTPKPCMLLVHGIRILDSRGAPIYGPFHPPPYLPLLGAVDRILRALRPPPLPLSRGSWLIDGEGNVVALCVSLFFFFSSFFYLLLLLLFFTFLPAAVCLFSSFPLVFSRKYSRTIHTYIRVYKRYNIYIYINDVIFEFVSKRLIPRGMGYLCSTSCRIDVSTITVLRFINEIKRFGYLLLRIPILQHVLPLLPLITGRIFSFPPFPLEETTPSNPPTGGFHRFRSFFGKREEEEGPN